MNLKVREVAIAIVTHFRDAKSAPANQDALASLFEPAARAAIQAMFEPTTAMASAGRRTGPWGCYAPDGEECASEVWHAMVNAALE